MARHSKEDIRQFVTDCRIEESKLRTFGPGEEKLWDMAEYSPFEQTDTFTPWGEWIAAQAAVRDFRNHMTEKAAGVGDEVTLPRPKVYVPDLGTDLSAGHGGYAWGDIRR